MEKAVVIAVCLGASLTDLRSRRIPNWLNGSGLVLVLGARYGSAGPSGVLDAFACLLMALPLVAMSLVRPLGFGMGDSKLMIVVFVGLGLSGLLALLIACAGGTLWALVSGGPRASVPIALAPFIAAGAVAASFPW
ncbi:MAG: A24 family peptidase [Solirubrobacterales bacterium]|nr:A24 family peptidase [Solirubrobacterales bacterium]